MKIKSITFFNIGPYIGFNKFDLSVSKDKNIVLIGGKNGAGKTTFFKAIKTCLYGSKVWGFDAPGKGYFSIISGLINSKSSYDNTSKAYVEIELVFDDGKQINTYLLHREWKKVKQSFFEFFRVKKNGVLIIRQEEDDFINYLLSIIPPDMFNFYFFDGESIAEFFLGTNGDKNFRNAFLKLYGLDTISLMVENFARNIKRTDSKKSSYDNYILAKNNYESAVKKLNGLHKEITSIENQIDLYKIQCLSLQNNYSKDGGIGLSEWKKLNSELMKEESNRDIINRWLKDVANNYLPFVILEKQLNKLLNELYVAQEKQKSDIVLKTLFSKSFNKEIEEFLEQKNVKNITVSELYDFIKSKFVLTDKVKDFDLSSNKMNRLISQIYDRLNFDKHTISKNVSQMESSLRKSKKLREQLNSSSIDGYENFVAQKEKFEKQISELTIEFERKHKEYESQKKSCDDELKLLDKAKLLYESALKSRSISDISERATATFSLIEEKLVLRQARILQAEFIKCFNSLINKNNFIDGIVIYSKINIIPYKFIKVTRNQLDNYKLINKNFLKQFDNVRFTVDIDKLEFCEVDSVKLPAPITAPFSQGERQVYIMAIYLALLKTSHKDIPFFIDTPFARIDSEHRMNIVNEFFGALNNQMFILSTDEEIVGEYKMVMSSKISNTFTLEINNYGTTNIKKDTYFGEET